MAGESSLSVSLLMLRTLAARNYFEFQWRVGLTGREREGWFDVVPAAAAATTAAAAAAAAAAKSA